MMIAMIHFYDKASFEKSLDTSSICFAAKRVVAADFKDFIPMTLAGSVPKIYCWTLATKDEKSDWFGDL